MEVAHVPVMLDEVMEMFSPFPLNGRVCDATLGGGGHTAELLTRCPECHVTAIDADREMVARGRERFSGIARCTILHGWFDEVIPELPWQDRILMDVGVSMFHLREVERGFSLRSDGPLDMRLDSESNGPNAAELVANASESELADIIFYYGEERYARRIARALVQERAVPITSTGRLAEIVRAAVPPAYRRARMHPATRTFQAIRIAVNDELGRIERAVPAAAARLAPGGRLAVITFHSLEDRIVKQVFRRLSGRGNPEEPATSIAHPPGWGSTAVADLPMYEREKVFRLCTRKPITPTEHEVASNPASRSAKLRVLERATGDERQ